MGSKWRPRRLLRGFTGDSKQHPAATTAMALNSSLAELEEGPRFRMKEAAAPSRPAGRSVLDPCSGSAEVGAE
eukprot:363843-Alexandrium_andersonii.AAC.1